MWEARVSAFGNSEAFLRDTLDPGELERVARFRFARDRAQFVIAHGLLRGLLGRYGQAAPETLRFEVGPWGKPALRGAHGSPSLTYNLSHSGDVVLIAVGRGRDVGVDVERWTGGIVYDELAEFCFSRAERAELAALPPAAKAAAFFAGWSRKEAYLKATGLGVTHGLDYFDVSLVSGAARLLADRRAPGALQHWRMLDLDISPGYSAAVVGQGRDWSFDVFRFSEESAG